MLARLVATRPWCFVAGELAGPCWDFGGLGPLLTNLASIALVGLTNNREANARRREAQRMEWDQPAGERRDYSEVRLWPMEPYRPPVTRTAAGKRRAYELRLRKPRADKKQWKF